MRPTTVPFQTPVVMVPTLVKDEPTTVVGRAVPVSVFAAAVTIQVAPKVQAWVLIVIAELTRSALVTSPVAVKKPVTVRLFSVPPDNVIEQLPARAQLVPLMVMIEPTPVGVPVIAGLGMVMALGKVPPVRVAPEAATVQVEPRAQDWPFTVVVLFAKSALVTRPVAVKPVVTTKLGAVRPLGRVVAREGTPELLVIRTALLTEGVLPSTVPVAV